MSSQEDGNADNAILPLKWKPGTDHMSKLLLNDPNVINLIVRTLVGENAPENSYTVAQTKWTDTKGKFTVYIPQNPKDDRFIPVLIAIQEKIDHVSMLETIDYCTRIYEEFKLLPTVLIISIKGWSSLEDREGFNVDEDSFLVQLRCSFWAQKCFLFFRDSVNTTDATNVPVPAFIKLCQFISDPNKTLCFSYNLETQTICLACEATISKDRLQ